MTENVLVRNNVQVFGKGDQAILFAHGFGCDQSFWRFVAPAFEDDYRVILFDYVGSGRSDIRAYHPERYNSLAGYAQDVLDICRALGLNEVIYVGHSVSSMVGVLALAREKNLFSQMVMVGASPSYINDPPDYTGGYARADLEGLLDLMEKNYFGWANYVAPLAMKNAHRPELAAELAGSFIATDHFIMHQFAAVTFLSDFRAELANVSVPTLIMQTTEDIFVPPDVAHYLHRQIPNSRLAWMQANGHFPHLSAPEETVQLIKAYMAGRVE